MGEIRRQRDRVAVGRSSTGVPITGCKLFPNSYVFKSLLIATKIIKELFWKTSVTTGFPLRLMEAAEPNNDGQQDVQRPVLLQCLPQAIQSCLGRILSENALKGHLIAYWFYMMAQIVSDSNENHSPCLLLFTLGAGVSITLALMATSAQSAGLLFPVSVMSVLEWLRLQFYWLVVTAHRCRISFLDGNWVPIPLNDRWDHITQVGYSLSL